MYGSFLTNVPDGMCIRILRYKHPEPVVTEDISSPKSPMIPSSFDQRAGKTLALPVKVHGDIGWLPWSQTNYIYKSGKEILTRNRNGVSKKFPIGPVLIIICGWVIDSYKCVLRQIYENK